MPGSTRSQDSSASTTCRSEDKFKLWLREVSCCSPIYSIKHLPKEIHDMVERSNVFPGWLFDQNSEYYKRFFSTRQHMHQYFGREPSSGAQEQIDPSLSEDLAHAFQDILYAAERHNSLTEVPYVDFCNESDLRQPLDQLANHLWCQELGAAKGFLSRSECTLKLPKTRTRRIKQATADSVAFLYNTSRYPISNNDIRKGLTCTTRSVRFLELVHWITEYKKGKPEEARRQICYGVVSSLWQRRVLGRMNDYVFATAHCDDTLDVYAARWRKTQVQNTETIGPKVVSSDRGSTSNNMAQTSAVGPEQTGPKEAKGATTRSRAKDLSFQDTDDGSTETPSLVNSVVQEEQYEILIFRFATYSTLNPAAMARYYLLMRASLRFASDYGSEIFGELSTLESRVEGLGQYEWYFPVKDNGEGPDRIPEEDHADGTGDGDTRVAGAEEEDGWKHEWSLDRQNAVAQLGDGSLQGLDTKSEVSINFNSRMSHYLSEL